MQLQKHIQGVLSSTMQDNASPHKLHSPSSQQALVEKFWLSPQLLCNPAAQPIISSMVLHRIGKGVSSYIGTGGGLTKVTSS